MIGTDEMSSTGMDITESFRPEDLSKTDFFDFVTAPDMDIGIGVGVSLHPHNHSHERIPTAANISHDGGGGGGSSTDVRGNGGNSNSNLNNSNNGCSDPTLQSYEFWHTDKDHSRLESTIFEDLDRYCWQQQANTQHQSPTAHTHAQSPTQQLSNVGNCSNTTHNATSTSSPTTSGSISQPSSTGTVSSIDNGDGQIYTLTVLNGNEPWLKREPDTQLANSLDLDSLLGNFPGYIKSEYPYDDSGFSTDGTKDANSDANGISLSQVGTHHDLSAGTVSGQSLPSLITAISGTGSISRLGNNQQLAQFQNNNNDWHMTNHNAEQNSAESLLRSALQGKGYSKGLQMQNGLTLLPTSPTIKDDEMRRILFPTDTDALSFGDSALNAAQMFDDTQSSHLIQHSPVANGSLTNASTNASNSVSSIIVDEMFLSLESFTDDFEKIKRIANEVQQFCSSTPTTDYSSNDVMMQLSPTNTQSAQLQQLHSPATTPTGGVVTTTIPSQLSNSMHMQTVPPTQPPQPLKPEVSTSTGNRLASVSGTTTTSTKTVKKYKRTTSATHSNNNNNPNVMNHNNNGGSNIANNNNGNSTGNSVGSTSSGSSSSNSSNSPTHCNGQRKERSLHYCSICSKGFKDKYSVNVHIRTHTGEKPFACSLCGKSFRQKAHLAKHYQTHMAQKNNGGIVKGGGVAKHHRNTATASAVNTAQHRGISVSSAVSNANIVANSATVGNILGTNLQLNGPTTTTTSAVLPPANGLLANR
ncbi:transcription factor Sp1-like [Teleopsis dalmanni]|uniref:transcription factor Sp1-like n=1 Tax=Teleopsis dalmanni TaxID=139649 RepID=UPI0018CDC465|nr:transcription factor Sp1-like [Teleopsis dalmanni]